VSTYDPAAEAQRAERRTRRLNALQQELGAAPHVLIKRHASRFRLPRSVKAELMDRFCSRGTDTPVSLTTLIVVAHPDDESIGAGARLRNLGDAWVVDLTDGAPRDLECAQRHGFGTPEEYARARHGELEEAMRIAGLPPNRLITLDFADGELTLRMAEVCVKIMELIDTLNPDVVLTHPYEGGHTDHDATAFAVHLACGLLRREGVQPPAVLELASYHARHGRKFLQQFLPHERADRSQRIIRLSPFEQALKQRMFRAFRSQRSVLSRFSTEFERFRPAPRYVFTEPPHQGPLNYEMYGDADRGRTWREQARRALESLRFRR